MPQTEPQTIEGIEARVTDALVEFGAERDKIRADATWDELDIDSLDLVELAQIVEDEYGVVLKESDLEGIATAGEAVEAVAARLGSS